MNGPYTGAPDPRLVQVFKSVRQDARSDPKPTAVPQSVTAEFTFDGAGHLPSAGDIVVLPIGQLSARIVGALIVADAIGSATIDVSLGTQTTWPSSVPIWDVVPTLTNAAIAPINTSAWKIINLQPQDVLIAKLNTISGAITTITLTLELRRLQWPEGSTTVTNNTGNSVVTNAFQLIALRH